MRKFCGKALLLLSMFIVSGNAVAASGWPSKYEGVMLQGFYWDSFKGTDNTKWSTLTEKADELSKYFKLIWTPNGGKPASSLLVYQLQLLLGHGISAPHYDKDI